MGVLGFGVTVGGLTRCDMDFPEQLFERTSIVDFKDQRPDLSREAGHLDEEVGIELRCRNVEAI